MVEPGATGPPTDALRRYCSWDPTNSMERGAPESGLSVTVSTVGGAGL